MARQQYTLLPHQIDLLSDACNPKSYLSQGAIGAFDVQARCVAVWAQVGAQLGFDPATIQTVQGVWVITAEALP